MKKNLTKLFALLLVLAMITVMFAGCKGNDEPTDPSNSDASTEPSSEATEKHENKVIYGSDTELSGDLGNAWWTNNATDKLIRDLTNDYDVIVFDQFGQMKVNETVSDGVQTAENEDGSATYTVKIKQGLTYCDGTPITAADYVAYLLVQFSPATLEAGATVSSDTVVGGNEYQNGESKVLAGLRLLDEYTYSISITPDYANYYYGLTYASLSPLYLPLYSSAALTVKDDGEGAYLDGGELKADEINASRYVYENRVTAGPYVIKSIDTGALTATLEINPNYAGNFEGQKPSIKTIVVVKSEDDSKMDAFTTGEITFLSQLSEGDQIKTALELVDSGKYNYCHYTRNGYGKIQFQCDGGPTQFQAVRQAVAYLLDREEFTNTFTGGYGSVVHGPYSTAQ